ncbi:hypothetical protein GWK91_00025 [Virgibacillus sp. MSP4-1]|uniref:hypothetical protein n=1 Tax=Virgibacillus sp. MSP4-1 TaxID=2700081 RepID=UPI0003A1BD2E|nr:hypothetical protein [Virgibacillus sp. MSP4-1]QHS21441.1 hypothetical protein GWK91_00025 [Virgibacillus sp. MSP4-1]
MGKKDTQKMIQIVSDFINELSDDQFTNLINGNAMIEYKENQNHVSSIDQMKSSVQQAQSMKEIEGCFKGLLKKDIRAFCKDCRIDIRKKDTKKELFYKIAVHFGITRPDEKDFNTLIKEFDRFTDVKEAAEFLNGAGELRTKDDLIRFANVLDVHIRPKERKADILHRIAESVVGSRLRAQVIKNV